MFKRLMLVTVLTALILSACGALGQQAPTATLAPNTDTPAPTVTQAIIATEPPVIPTTAAEATLPAVTEAVAANSPTPDAARPTNPPDCKNSASFVADVTVPDNTEIEAGATFVKTWRIANNGTCVWGPDYTLIHYSDERMGAPASIPLGVTYPGQTYDVTISLTAPKSVGAHRANFVIKNPAGLIMKVNDDSRLWLIIQVKDAGAPTAAPTVAAALPTATQAAAVVQPTNTTASTSSGTGFATVTCGFSIDQSKLLQVINAVNAYRTQSGLPQYVVNAQLAKAAQAHANDMACNNLTSDAGSNNSTIVSRITASGYTAAFSAENLYFSNPPVTGQDAVNTWINNSIDQKDKLNLISDTFIDIGVGYASFNNTGYYVIVFATP